MSFYNSRYYKSSQKEQARREGKHDASRKYEARIAELEQQLSEAKLSYERLAENIPAMNENTLRLEAELAEARKANLRQRVEDIKSGCGGKVYPVLLSVMRIAGFSNGQGEMTTFFNYGYCGGDSLERMPTDSELVDWLIEQGVEGEG